MSIPCPACGKADQTEAVCARCGCDLSHLQAVVRAAANALATARACLRAANWPAALTWAEQSWQLRHTAQAARVAFLAAGASGDTARITSWRQGSAAFR